GSAAVNARQPHENPHRCCETILPIRRRSVFEGLLQLVDSIDVLPIGQEKLHFGLSCRWLRALSRNIRSMQCSEPEQDRQWPDPPLRPTRRLTFHGLTVSR